MSAYCLLLTSLLMDVLECCRLYVGQPHSPERLVEELLRLEYRRVEEVADGGEVARHGGIVDVFPATFEAPLRVELDHERIVSLRSVNPKTAETLDRHTMVVVLSPRLHPRAFLGPPPSPITPAPDLEHAVPEWLQVPFEATLDLEPGTYVVHLDHGIGRSLGRTVIAGSRGPQDVLMLEYADGDRLYVPMDQLHLVQRYVAFGSRAPVLHKLGGAAWGRAKVQAFVGAWTYAKGLLDVQAKRMALPGFAFSADQPWQRDFEAAFPFRETRDQAVATAEVKRSMEDPRPMDRLLMGDVGYGKTEVAMRAAFKAVMDHQQVAVLVPTTILAFQHHRTFTARMQAFPIQVEMLTRFQSDAEQRRVMDAVAHGRVDIVIGTHRLLSGDVRFKELGLVVVDEEQRFGVQDKERLKRWRTQTDVLTLSATPIPRTLYLALTGARELSVLAIPPENRHPVDTQVMEEDDRALKQWVLRELDRGGQVYLVHNRVRSIFRVAQRLSHLVPEARVGVAHGRMQEAELEQVMMAFIEGRMDVLVTTTIIESGIDIPNANTLIVQQAEAFGLADLYQLRGRVGRFDRKAYAYLVVSKGGVLSAEARRRLEAMCEHAALGSGFRIAMEDLKIRGAGNLLGLEQSGHVSAVGFDLYCRLLREAVARLRGRETGDGRQETRDKRQEARVRG